MIKTLTNLLLVPTIGALMMTGYALSTKDYGLAIASGAVVSLGIFVYARVNSELDNKK